MKVIVTNSYDETCAVIANMIKELVNAKPDAKLGLATGGTPVPIYKKLIEMNKAGEVDFSRVHTVNLDEYRGLPRTNEQSYWYFMHDNLFNHVNIKPERINLPNGENLDAQAACTEYNEILHSVGAIDLQLLGIGTDGHIGFNEPADHFPLETHCVELEESTIEDNKRFFANKDEVPRQAYTMGIKTIMQAKKVLMVANGKNKAEIIKKAFFGPVTPEVPASILQMHPDFILVADEDALSEI